MQKLILITGLVPGYPNEKTSLKIAQVLSNSGADVLELSASFSEPVADGPTLQMAHQKVLAGSFDKAQAFALYKKISQKIKTPLFLIEYANIIYRLGFDNYYARASKAGIKYLAVPDVPLEEISPFLRAAKKHGIAQIFLLAPTTPDDRARGIIKIAESSVISSELPTFIYLVSVTGVTGSRTKISLETQKFVKRIRKLTNLPLIVGFGISKKSHVQAVLKAGGSGVVTCSKIVDIVHKHQKDFKKMLDQTRAYVNGLKVE